MDTFNTGSTRDLNADRALIDVGSAHAGAGNTSRFNVMRSVPLTQQLYAMHPTSGTTLAVTETGTTRRFALPHPGAPRPSWRRTTAPAAPASPLRQPLSGRMKAARSASG